MANALTLDIPVGAQAQVHLGPTDIYGNKLGMLRATDSGGGIITKSILTGPNADGSYDLVIRAIKPGTNATMITDGGNSTAITNNVTAAVQGTIDMAAGPVVKAGSPIANPFVPASAAVPPKAAAQVVPSASATPSRTWKPGVGWNTAASA